MGIRISSLLKAGFTANEWSIIFQEKLEHYSHDNYCDYCNSHPEDSHNRAYHVVVPEIGQKHAGWLLAIVCLGGFQAFCKCNSILRPASSHKTQIEHLPKSAGSEADCNRSVDCVE